MGCKDLRNWNARCTVIPIKPEELRALIVQTKLNEYPYSPPLGALARYNAYLNQRSDQGELDMKHSLPLLLFIFVLIACAPSSKIKTGNVPPPKALATTPWPMSGHDLQHTRRSEYSGPASPREKWTFVTGGYVGSSPAIGADGTIYIGSRDTNVYAINPDGSKKWEFATGGDVKSSPAIGADGTIYVAVTEQDYS